MNVIVFQNGSGLEIVYPCAGVSIDSALQLSVPSGAQHRVIDSSLLPADATYRDAWTADLSAEPFAVTLDPVKKAAIDKRLAAEEVEVWFEAAVAEGYTTDEGWTLGLEPNDVTLLTGNYVLAKEAAALGMPIPVVIDRNGVPHPMESIEDLTGLMLAYGQYRANLSAEYASRKAAIEG